ncbi:disease resistance RPP13-like protein 1 [Carex littledalei]|uniref:Disease resistance RPP13-like protein 1 n=1 Tax=Carex littledalei TaxID=544730 RepID=A0A833QNU3_9POAL|nr:disease resistance RPP13-like protein 1 [Carex littledalei]
MQLKDVMYDADDVIDLCQIKAKERLAGSSSHSRCGFPLLSCFGNPFFAHEIGSKIKDINSRLEGIAKRRTDLGLTQSPIFPTHGVRRVDSIISRKTDPLIVLDDIVGEKIEEDTELLVNWLTEEEKGVRENVLVAAIVGMGGIGKTTLAKTIFNDPRIQEEFQLKIWVCVSKEVKGVELLKCVIREAGEEPANTNERSELVPILERLVQKKKYLLVLDDVWEESRAVWDSLLRAPMSGGAYGSRLLVTTRDERVANGMRAAKLHRVEKLSDKDGWSLLIKQVLPNGIESEIEDHRDIGMQIVEKCDGLPLAIKSIGGVLCTKGNSRENWQAILRSNVWSMDGLPGDVHRAIYLSYEDLPPPLKQCFIFCSLFLEDYEFDREKLIYGWLAEGFLQNKEDFWELGNEYYIELLQRNILEDTHKYSNQTECKMHDILWSFACQLGKNENYLLRGGQAVSRFEGSMKLRRLSIEGNEVNIEVIRKEKGLRTLIYFEPEIALDDMCKAFSNLRIIDLGSCNSNLSSLPDSLCDLVHLRYLDVSNTKLVKIPNSIGNLRNLVHFSCYGCEELSHVPHSIGNLRELRYLNFKNTKVEAIPMELNNLEKLSHLFGFVPYKNSLEGFSSLDGLELLSKLIGLSLGGLERVSDRNIAERANLRSKNQLLGLFLRYTSLSSAEQLSQTDEKKISTEDVLNELCPPRSLKGVLIEGYFGRCLPNWLNFGAVLPNLRDIDISECACFEVLPMLSQLPNLHRLVIRGAFSVERVGEEFMQGDTKSKDPIVHKISGSARPAFPKLNYLYFKEMPNWKEWQWNKGQPAMPKLKELFIQTCPELRSLPEGLLLHATSLEFLKIKNVDKLITVENIPSIKDIRIFSNPNLTRISNLPSISHIRIKNCPNLKDLMNPKALRTIKLGDYTMKFLPDYLRTTMTHKLIIWCHEELLLKIANQGENGSEWHKFKHISKVKIGTKNRSLHATYQKTPFSFTTNVNANYLTTTMSRKLIIHCDEELLLKIANQGESGSEWHKFKHISKVKISTKDESLHATYQKTPFSFTTNVNANRVQMT